MRSINSLPITQLLLTVSCLLSLTGVEAKVVVGSTRNEESNGTVSVVNIQDHNKTQYLNQNFEDGNYNYGYDIKPSGPNGQFHHENKASDGVVYGCYGYLDPNNQAQITFYISDAWGYRPVRQEQPVEVFFPAQNPEGTTDMKGDTIQWAELIFPEKCTYYAQQVAVAASSNVGQEIVGTPFGILPVTPQSSPFTTVINRRPTSTATNLNPLTVPAASTPTVGIAKPATSNSQNRIPSASNRVPASTLRTPIPPSGQFTTPINTGGISTGSDSRIPAVNETQIEMSTVTTHFVAQNDTAIHGNQGFGSGGTRVQSGNDNSGGFRGPSTVGSFGNSGNQGNTFGGPTTATIGNVGNPGLGGFRGPTTIGSSGNTGLGIPSGSTSVTSSPFHGGVGGNDLNVEIKSPGDSLVSVQPGNGGFNGPKLGGEIVPPRNGNVGSGSGITDTSAFGNGGNGGTGSTNPIGGSSRAPANKPSQATGFTGTDGSKRPNVFESTRTPTATSSIPSNGGQDNNSPFRRTPSQSTSTRKPTENPHGSLNTAGPLNSFYSEGSSSSIYPEGNHLSTGAPGSHPASPNNIGETLEQEVEGTGTAIFPGRKTSTPNTNKSAALSTLPSSSFHPSTQSGSPHSVATTTNPNFSGAYQQATRQPTQNPTNFQSIRNDENSTGGLNPTRNQESFGFGSNSGGLRGVSGTTNGPAGSTNGGLTGAYSPQQPSSAEVTQGIGTSGTPTYTKSPNHFSTPAGFGGIFHSSSPLNDGTSTTCPQICNTCSSNNNNKLRQPDSEEIEYSKIPGAMVANIPVIYYPDCSANAYSRPAIVPFCPSEQQASCSNQQPLTMKFQDVPAARSASHPTGRGNRRVIRKTRHSQPANN